MDYLKTSPVKGCTRILAVLMFFAVIFFVFPLTTHAASLSLRPATGSYRVGEKFSVRVVVSSTNQAMNAVNAEIGFSPEFLEVVSISQSGSLIDFFAQEPAFDNKLGRVLLEGVAFNGYDGPSGLIATITFRAKKSGATTVSFFSGDVLANDGFGTSILSGLDKSSIVIEDLARVTDIKIEKEDEDGNIIVRDYQYGPYQGGNTRSSNSPLVSVQDNRLTFNVNLYDLIQLILLAVLLILNINLFHRYRYLRQFHRGANAGVPEIPEPVSISMPLPALPTLPRVSSARNMLHQLPRVNGDEKNKLIKGTVPRKAEIFKAYKEKDQTEKEADMKKKREEDKWNPYK